MKEFEFIDGNFPRFFLYVGENSDHTFIRVLVNFGHQRDYTNYKEQVYDYNNETNNFNCISLTWKEVSLEEATKELRKVCPNYHQFYLDYPFDKTTSDLIKYNSSESTYGIEDTFLYPKDL